jgi:exosome complex component RRP40
METTNSSHGFAPIPVLPGDDVTNEIIAVTTTLKLGYGLLEDGDRILATSPGILVFKRPNSFSVISDSKRYIAAVGDNVIGIVVDKLSEHYKVQLYGNSIAILPVLAFDGASRRNKPDLEIGTLIYARVTKCSLYMEPELSCQALPGMTKKDWVTKQSFYGELTEGTCIKVSTSFAYRLLLPTCSILSTLGGVVPFEIAVGMNGYLYVKSVNITYTNAIVQILPTLIYLSEKQAVKAIKGSLPNFLVEESR